MSNLIPISNQNSSKLELIQLLQEKERRIKSNPLKYLSQHEKQLEASNSQKAIRALFWGNRVGKTEWGAQEIAKYALGEMDLEVKVYTSPHNFYVTKFIPREVLQPIEIWCAAPSYDAQKETTQKKLEGYIPRHRIVDITYIKKNTWGEIIIDNGTKINFKSYEQGRAKFQGVGKRVIWFDEEPPKDIWEECFVRSEAGIPLDIILTMTAINGMTWVYDDIYLDTSNDDLFVSEAGWDNNPWLTEKQKAQMARGLSPQSLKVRREGKFVKRVGLVAPWWSREQNLKDVGFNKDWEVVIAIDFGFSKAASVEFWGADYDDNLFLFDGFYGPGITTPKMAENIDKICTKYGLDSKEIFIIADSAQANDIQQMTDLGYTIMGIKKESGSSSENWDEYRANKMEQYADKIFVSTHLAWENPKNGNQENWFVREIESLRWDEKTTKSGETQQGARWDSSQANHAIDSFTYYLVNHLDSPEHPKERKPWDGKLPGTFVPPSVVESEENDWNEDSPNDWEVI